MDARASGLEGPVSLTSLSSKLYLAIAVLALGLWIFGVSGGTIVTVVLAAFMMTMHAGGHGGARRARALDTSPPCRGGLAPSRASGARWPVPRGHPVRGS